MDKLEPVFNSEDEGRRIGAVEVGVEGGKDDLNLHVGPLPSDGVNGANEVEKENDNIRDVGVEVVDLRPRDSGSDDDVDNDDGEGGEPKKRKTTHSRPHMEEESCTPSSESSGDERVLEVVGGGAGGSSVPRLGSSESSHELEESGSRARSSNFPGSIRVVDGKEKGRRCTDGSSVPHLSSSDSSEELEGSRDRVRVRRSTRASGLIRVENREGGEGEVEEEGGVEEGGEEEEGGEGEEEGGEEEEEGEEGRWAGGSTVPHLSSSESSEELEGTRERAPGLMISVEDSSDTEEDGVPSNVGISDRARAVVELPVAPPRHPLLADLTARSLGLRMRPSFTARRCGSVELVRRLKLGSKLVGHEGCVNCLGFNMSGTRLVSGSDDLQCIVWDWARGKKMTRFHTGHKANVFQAKFLPGDLLISTCSRDGQVRLAELSVTGSLVSTKRLAQHRGPAHKMSQVSDSGQVMLSAGEDGQVFSIDIREAKPEKILLLRNEKDKKVPIYSIHSSPSTPSLFCTAGRDQYVRIFDRRFLGQATRSGGQVARHCPTDLRDSETFKAYITAAVFSNDGQEVIGSYNDEDIYLFNTEDPEGADFKRRYQGHRNSATVKGVNFYGPNSEFVISGSDCGNIFIWDKETRGIVKLMPGDDNGVVNVLEPHPSLPVLATSGLDDEVKIWLPTQVTAGPGHCWQREQKEYTQKTVHRNLEDREAQRSNEPDPLDGQMLWVLWRHIRRVERRRREAAAARGEEETGSDVDSESDEDESDGEEGPRGRMCTQS